MVNDAIAMLNKYLEINQIDEEAWSELCDIYLSRQNFTRAQYCFEEILSVNPMNYQFNFRYAEILFSSAMAQQSNLTLLETSRKYYAHGLVLVDNQKEKSVGNNVVRALWGLIKVCQTIE